MKHKASIYIIAVALAACAILCALPLEPLFQLSPRDAFGLLIFALVGVLSELLAIDFGTGRQATSSLAFLPLLSTTVLFAPILAVLVAVVVLLVAVTVLTRQELSKAIFNLGQGILSVGTAAIVYSALLSEDLLGSPVRLDINYFGFFLLAATFFGTNILLTSTALSLIRGGRFGEVLKQVIGPRGGNLWYDLLASPIAIVPVVLYRTNYITGILLILLPLHLIRHSYLSKLQLEEANRDLLKVLVKAIETRDPYTSGHSVRVATLARTIAAALRLSRRKILQIETAALLHDIGKIDSIYATVIRKPHDLTADERSLIRTHATKGADLLQTLASVPADVIRGVRHHHERYDGTGYPSGLRAEEIPISARIIMLCDSIDAMLSDRPYRPALELNKVRGELRRCAGSQFDPEIVKLILKENTLERAASLVPPWDIPEPRHVAVSSA